LSLPKRLILTFVVAVLAVASSIAQDARNDRQARLAPRWPDGRVNLNSPAGEKGLWGGSARLAVNPRSYEPRTTLNAPIHIDNVPLQDWARALLDYRHTNFLKDEPYTRCKPPGCG
jgi:hypothetical protein